MVSLLLQLNVGFRKFSNFNPVQIQLLLMKLDCELQKYLASLSLLMIFLCVHLMFVDSPCKHIVIEVLVLHWFFSFANKAAAIRARN